MESEQINHDLKLFELDKTVNDVVAENHALFNIKSIELEIENHLLNNKITADEGLIMQVLRNVLVNAVNYSPDNSVMKIKLSNDSGMLKIQVIDQGPGIPEPEKESIFDKFIQSSFTKNGAGGTGLGLAICKQIIMAHKGEIWAENNELNGAVFVITLPQAAEQQDL